MNYELRFTQDVITDLAYSFDANQLQIIRTAIIKGLDAYELREKPTTSIVPADDYNNLLVRKYLIKKHLDGTSERSIEQYKRETINFLTAVNKKATDVTSEDVEMYLLTYKATHKLTNTSYNNLICYIRNFYDYLENEDLIDKNPFKRISKLKDDTIPEQPISKSDEEKLYLSCTNLRDRAMMEYFFATGCRVSEVCGVKVSDIDFLEKRIKVIGKGAKFRYVYLNDKATIHLKRYLEVRPDTSEYLFSKNRAPYGKLTAGAVRKVMHTVAKDAGVSNLHPHRIRATFCTRLIDMGMSLHKVREIMGHDSIETTMIYYRNIDNARAQTEYDKYM